MQHGRKSLTIQISLSFLFGSSDVRSTGTSCMKTTRVIGCPRHWVCIHTIAQSSISDLNMDAAFPCFWSRNNVREALTSLPSRKPRRAGSRRVNNGVYMLFSAAVGDHCASELKASHAAAAILSIDRRRERRATDRLTKNVTNFNHNN